MTRATDVATRAAPKDSSSRTEGPRPLQPASPVFDRVSALLAKLKEAQQDAGTLQRLPLPKVPGFPALLRPSLWDRYEAAYATASKHNSAVSEITGAAYSAMLDGFDQLAGLLPALEAEAAEIRKQADTLRSTDSSEKGQIVATCFERHAELIDLTVKVYAPLVGEARAEATADLVESVS